MRRSLTVLVLTLSACTAIGSEARLLGVWEMVSFRVDGVTHQVERGVNTASIPWVEFGAVMTGSAGCNGFGNLEDAPYQVRGKLLLPGKVVSEAALCGADDYDPMLAEYAFQEIYWPDSEVQMGIEANRLVLETESTRLEFVKVTTPPTNPPPPPPTSHGRLDCSPGVVEMTDHADDGQDPADLVTRLGPEVVDVEVEYERDIPVHIWGHGPTGEVVAAVSFGDVVPVVWHTYVCADR